MRSEVERELVKEYRKLYSTILVQAFRGQRDDWRLRFLQVGPEARNDGFVMLPRDRLTAATTNTITADDYDYFMQERRTTPWRMKKVSAKYYSKIEVFVKQEADQIRPHGPKDYEIRLLEGTIAPFARNYRPMSIQELEAVKYLDEQLAKGFIQPSSSAAEEARREHPSLYWLTTELLMKSQSRTGTPPGRWDFRLPIQGEGGGFFFQFLISFTHSIGYAWKKDRNGWWPSTLVMTNSST